MPSTPGPRTLPARTCLHRHPQHYTPALCSPRGCSVSIGEPVSQHLGPAGPKRNSDCPGPAPVLERAPTPTQRSTGSAWCSSMPNLFSRARALNPGPRAAPAQPSGTPGRCCCNRLHWTCPPASCSLQAAARLSCLPSKDCQCTQSEIQSSPEASGLCGPHSPP